VASHYELLGVDPDATVEEVQRAYRLLALRHHPDVAPDADMAMMAAINGAWEVLSDPDRRRSYDASMLRPHAGTGSGPGPTADADPAAGAERGWQPLHWDTEDADPEDLSDEPYAPVARTPADMLVMTPVLLVIAAVGMFFFSVMSGSEALRTFSILLLPLAGVGFVMAPLIVMLRSRGRETATDSGK
jgi:hypothetical protein